MSRSLGITATPTISITASGCQRAGGADAGHRGVDRPGQLTPHVTDLPTMRLVVGDVGQEDCDADQVLRLPASGAQGSQHVAKRLPELFDDAALHDPHVLIEGGLPPEVERVAGERAVGIAAGRWQRRRIDRHWGQVNCHW